VVGDFVTVTFAQDDLPDFHVPSEHLVEVATLAMGLSSLFHRSRELEGPQLLDDIRHVVIEVTTHDNRSAGVLSNDVPNDINDPQEKIITILFKTCSSVISKTVSIFLSVNISLISLKMIANVYKKILMKKLAGILLFDLLDDSR
jgi:hypothetical protein